MDYRAVRDDLGTIADLSDLAAQLRAEDMSLCIDLVCNHTAKEHAWAQKAMAGEQTIKTTTTCSPTARCPTNMNKPCAKSSRFQIRQFHSLPGHRQMGVDDFQRVPMGSQLCQSGRFWRNVGIMLYLANQGVEVLRLDAVAFMWKRLGTDCENQPEAHAILQAFRALSRIAAPGLLLKAEAIVPPPQLVPYLGRGDAANKECEVAYHNVFMVMLWSSLAERKVALMTHALQQMPSIPSRTSWLPMCAATTTSAGR